MKSDIMPLRRAGNYALNAIDTVTPDVLGRPTPCSEWDLHTLLRHVCESVAALHESLDTGRVDLYPMDDQATSADPAWVLRHRVTTLIDQWPATGTAPAITIADHSLDLSAITGVAAIEIAVHGWDIAQASGHPRSIPPDLATDLLPISALLVPDGNRHPLFAPPVQPSPNAGPCEELLAFLGRPVPPKCGSQPTRLDTPWP
jgi:uncharacterized protein (TIGR03086 family)